MPRETWWSFLSLGRVSILIHVTLVWFSEWAGGLGSLDVCPRGGRPRLGSGWVLGGWVGCVLVGFQKNGGWVGLGPGKRPPTLGGPLWLGPRPLFAGVAAVGSRSVGGAGPGRHPRLQRAAQHLHPVAPRQPLLPRLLQLGGRRLPQARRPTRRPRRRRRGCACVRNQGTLL